MINSKIHLRNKDVYKNKINVKAIQESLHFAGVNWTGHLTEIRLQHSAGGFNVFNCSDIATVFRLITSYPIACTKNLTFSITSG